MARLAARTAHERVFAVVFEAHLDRCQLKYGRAVTVAAKTCQAALLDSGAIVSSTGTTTVLPSNTFSPVGSFVRMIDGPAAGEDREILTWNEFDTITHAVFTGGTPLAGNAFQIHDADGAVLADRMCYNTFPNCQDTPNYNPAPKIWQFCTRGMPIPVGQTIRPYVEGRPSGALPAIDLEGRLSPRARVQLSLIDETAGDGELDPYLAKRQTPSAGTWLGRFMARNPHFFGRFGKLRKGYVVDPWDWATFIDELYIIEAMTGPHADGTVRIVLKDPLKLADRLQLPKPTGGRLAAAITETSLSLTLASGQGTKYTDPVVSGEQEFVSIGEEVIRYTAIAGDTLSWPDTGHRAQFGTTAKSASVDATVQQCLGFVGKSWSFAIQKIANAIGIEDTYIDLVLLAKEEIDWWGAAYTITWCVPKPTPAGQLLEELLHDGGALNWWHPTEQKFKVKVNMPNLLTGVPVFRDVAEIIEGSVEREPLEGLRLNSSHMNFDPVSATTNLREAKNYRRTEGVDDASAQGPNEHNDVRAEVLFSRWLTSNAAARSLVSHRVAYRRDTPVRIKFSVDPKDYDVTIGDIVDIETAQHVDETGAPKRVRCRITKWHDRGTHLEAEAVTTTFAKRYAFVNATGAADYPSANESQRLRAYISGNDGLMSNGDPGYLVA